MMSPTEQRIEVLEKALQLACERLEEVTGSCPLDNMDDDIANAMCKRDNCSNTCAADCFIDYFIHKAGDGVGHD